MRLVWKSRNNCGSSANIIASVDGSPGCITEKDRFDVKHDHRQEFLNKEKNIFNARQSNTIKAIADRRFDYKNTIMTQDRIREDKEVRGREIKRENMDTYIKRVKAKEALIH